MDNGYSRHFGYDELHRLTSANTNPAQGELWGKGTYTWDAMGNLLSYELGRTPEQEPESLLKRARPKPPDTKAVVPRGRTVSFAYAEPTPMLTSVATNDVPRSVQYDATGNETAFFATRTYSPRNLLAEMTDLSEGDDEPHRVRYSYDGRGIRVIRAESPADGAGTTARRYFFYAPELRLLAVTRDDGPNVWLRTSLVADKNVKYEIVWFGDRPVAQVTPGGSAVYTFADHLGTPILQTDATRSIVWRAEHEPFGNIYAMREGVRTDQPLRFPGQEVASTWEGPEENYNVFRWYRAGWGRYTQADPIGLDDGPNLYTYVRGLPTTLIDPLGLKSKCQDCDECPSGVWRWEGPARTAGAGIGTGGSTTVGTLCCFNERMPMKRGTCIKVRIECTWRGIMIGGSFGLSGPIGSKPNECGCNSRDLLGEQPDSFVGEAGPFTVEVGRCSSDPSRQTYSGGLGIGLGAGFGRQSCVTKRSN